jgi:hypothetical protein
MSHCSAIAVVDFAHPPSLCAQYQSIDVRFFLGSLTTNGVMISHFFFVIHALSRRLLNNPLSSYAFSLVIVAFLLFFPVLRSFSGFDDLHVHSL